MKIILSISIALLLMNNATAQQLLRISGTVISATDKRPLSGVSLAVKGTDISTVTGKEGDFSILVFKKSVLVISHVGYAIKEINMDTIVTRPLTILLTESSITMDEVTVSTGYQEITKQSATGSYEKINNDLFNRSTGTSILSRLNGIAGSVLFDRRKGKEDDMKIRGISTLGFASTAPLIVLDNFPYEGDINNINPNDIESITILKDAAAASIWGARAGNGVIVITTKKGQFNQPFKLSVNTDVIVTAKPDLFSQKNMSTSDYIDVEQFLFKKGYYNSSISNTSSFPPLSPVVEILARQRAGTISEAAAIAQINELRTLDVRNDFEKYLYRVGIIQQYGLNVSGGSKNFKYLLSGGYDRNMTTLAGNGNERITLRSGNSFIPVKNLQLDFSIGYTRSNITNNSPGGYNDITIAKTGAALYPYTRLANDSGKPLPIDYFYRGIFTDTAGKGKLLDWKYRPLDELNNVRRSTVLNAVIVNIGLKYSFSRALNAEIKYQYQNTQNNSNNISNLNSFLARNLINQFTQYDGTNIKYIVPYGGILDAGQNSLNSYGFRGQINFSKAIKTRHIINAIAGGEVREVQTSSAGSRVYGYDEKLNFTNVDFVNRYPTFDNVAGNATIPSGIGFSSLLDRYVSIYANASYTYDKLYTLSGSFRKDASNLFGVKTNQKGVPLWSGGAAWNISEESFYHIQWLPLLKLRMTYGYSGNVSNSVSALTTISYYAASNQPIINVPFTYIQNLPNPHLQWEKVGMMNIGLDMSTRNRRITGSVEYFIKKATGLLSPQSLDPTLGASFFTTNSANMKGKGFDVIINSRNIVNHNFRWETNITFSSVKNIITKYLYTPVTNGFKTDGLEINPLAGYEPYMIVSFKWGGLDSLGNPSGYVNGQKSINYTALFKTPIENQVISGSALPHYFGSFRNTFWWKHLSLSINITYKLGYYFRKPTLSSADLFNKGIGNIEYNNRWQKPGDENTTNVPSLLYPVNTQREQFYHYADINALRADHTRLNDIRLSWELPPRVLQNLHRERFEVFAYFSSLNILIWKANKAGIDPEYPSGLKAPMQMSFGIKTNF